MTKMRKYHSADFKQRVALEALKEQHTLAELSKKHSVHVSQIQKWKDALHKASLEVFQDKREKNTKNYEKTISQLHEKIGKLTVERDFLEHVSGR